ncbi:MAG: TonB-dependent receptor [Saprospiraceae bacterium]|nr:TonB-dependent receptor [Saprospiraceae bacterium]
MHEQHKRSTVTSLFTVFLFSLLAQSDDGSVSSSKTPITGQLLQEANREPLPYAMVALYNEQDSNLVNSALSSDQGWFRMEAAPGKYYAEINFIGYEDRTIPSIEVQKNLDSLQLGQVFLKSDAIALEEVTVTAEKSQMQLKLDRRVFNVGEDLSNSGSNAADILDRVPSVTVDPEGNVSLRGSQGVRILVNGKPSGLLSSGETEALLRMQGDIIESVEIITNPSARYEAEGEAGIINLILKKNKEKGFNGSFGLTAGRPDNYGASYSLNLRRSDFNFFSNFGMDYRKTPGGGWSEQRFFTGGALSTFYRSETEQTRGGVGGYLQLGTDWNIDQGLLLTGALLFRKGQDKNDAFVTYEDFNPEGATISFTERDVAESENEYNLEGSLNLKKTFDDPDHTWTTTITYIVDDDTELADYVQKTDTLGALILQRSSNTEDELNFLLQSDYIKPINENGRLEAGMRIALRKVNNDFMVEESDDGTFEALDNFDDQLEYLEDIYAAYFMIGDEFGKIGLQAGLRAEYSDISATLQKINSSNEQNYLSFFPSASVSYKFSGENQLQLSYSRRLSRPYFRSLLPFSNYNDPRNNNIGNPNLRPEFTHSLETGYLNYFTKGSYLVSVYYRHTDGVIEEIILPAEDGTAIEYPVNLSTRNAYGVEMNFSYDLTDQWDMNTDLNFFRSMIDGMFEGVQYTNDTYAMLGRLTTNYDIGQVAEIQASFNYLAPQRTTQGRRLSSYNFDLAASMDVLKNRGTLTLSARDIFNTRVRRSIIDQIDYRAESSFQWRRRQGIVLSFNYRINQEKSEK